MSDRERKADCDWFDERLEPWLDGELQAEEAQAVERHVADCARCRREVDLAQRITNGLRSLKAPGCPNLVVETPGRERDGRRHRLVPALAAGLMAGALALGVVWQMNRTTGPEEPSRAELAEARADLELALGYVAAAGRAAGRDVGGVLADDGVLRPIRSGLNVKLKIPVPREAHNEMVENQS